jgi:hypothetical protein
MATAQSAYHHSKLHCDSISSLFITIAPCSTGRRSEREDDRKPMKSMIVRAAKSSSFTAALIAGLAASASAASLHRLSVDFQNSTSVGGSGEILTTAKPTASPVTPSTTVAPAGNLVYTKSLSILDDVVYITFSAQADEHAGAALLMQATVTDSSGDTTICEPLSGQTGARGGGANLPTMVYASQSARRCRRYQLQ